MSTVNITNTTNKLPIFIIEESAKFQIVTNGNRNVMFFPSKFMAL